MDPKELSLYQEENRQKLIELQSAVKELSSSLAEMSSRYVPPHKQVEVSGHVSVDNLKNEVSFKNIKELTDAISDLKSELKQAIEKGVREPHKSVIVENIDKAKPEEVKLSNLSDLWDIFEKIDKSISKIKPVVVVEKQNIVWPRTASEAVPVRLADGKEFYKAIQSVSLGQGSGQITVATRIATDGGDANVSYIGKAAVGSLESGASWQIQKVDETSGTVITWADGNPHFDNVWNDRESLTYS